uniref:Olfactory receptor n=1 Tax=Leptobrachium leishanense TaxID=445787 RepID=A0A8C5QNE2_9ANUR
MLLQNTTNNMEFHFLGFSTHSPIILFLIFLLIYIFNVSGNLIIIFITSIDAHLQKPMYFFIGNLAVVDISFTTVTLPKLLSTFPLQKSTISFVGCMLQMFFFLSIGVTESFLLAVMSYDRYNAVCNPYNAIMTNKCCKHLVLGCWMGGLLTVILPIVLISRLPFCLSRVINHFFCDISPVIQLSCSNIQNLQLFFTFISSVVVFGSFPIILLSYVQIVLNILRASTHRKKTFSTCSAHLTVVLIYYGSIIFIYIRPNSRSNLDLDKTTSLLYSVVTPTLNPLIYSIRNDEIKNAIKKLFGKKTSFSAAD